MRNSAMTTRFTAASATASAAAAVRTYGGRRTRAGGLPPIDGRTAITRLVVRNDWRRRCVIAPRRCEMRSAADAADTEVPRFV